MKQLLRLLPCLLFALPAYAGADEDFSQWQQLADPDASAVDFGTAYQFLSDHKGWPQESLIRLRAEQAALDATPDKAAVQHYCADFPPISGRGMIACAQAGAGDAKQREAWVKQAWLQGDFSGAEEDAITARYHFTRTEDEARVERLLFEGKASGAKRMLPRLTPPQRLLAEARMALINDARDVNARVYRVPKALRNDAGLMFNRIQWRSRHGLDDGVVELLNAAPKNPPYADAWWPYRAAAVRDALEAHKVNEAMHILLRHGDLNTENMADALFLKGWITMQFKGNAREAYKDFYALYGAVGTPVSKARAAYWAGRAAKKNGNAEIARAWFAKAGGFPTTYYGQLALAESNSGQPLALPDAPHAGEVANHELAEIASGLYRDGKTDLADQFVTVLTEHSNATQAAALAERMQDQRNLHGAVKVAKQALRGQVVLVEAGWPLADIPDQAALEPALVLAIARQESEFNPKARSRADARGLMQLLPGTARHIAKADGLPYDAGDLYDPQANMVMGSHYLNGLVQGWDGSYVLAIASYNAGPANVRKWVARFGTPPHTLEGAIDWVEKIPFSETRNYVQRVLENLQVYRTRMNDDAPLNISGDLVR